MEPLKPVHLKPTNLSRPPPQKKLQPQPCRTQSAMMRVATRVLGPVLVSQWATEALFHAAKAPMLRACGDAKLEDVDAAMASIWQEFMKDGVVMQQTSADNCAISQGAASDRFVLVDDPGRMICESRPAKPELAFLREPAVEGYLSPGEEFFDVEQFSVAPGLSGGATRNVATAWPQHCTAADPCPMVVFLHGAGEHGTESWRLTSWGLLNYYAKDSACRKSLGSLIVMPQIEEQENWAADGPAIFQHFVMPFVKDMLQKNDNLDANRIAIAGYSQGGVGAVLGAVLYPDTFSALAAGSPAMPLYDWDAAKDVFAGLLVPGGAAGVARPRLQQVVIAFSDQDTFDTKKALRTLMGIMDHAGILEEAAMTLRLYKDIPHMAASEALFNHWMSLHELLWLGRFDTKLE